MVPTVLANKYGRQAFFKEIGYTTTPARDSISEIYRSVLGELEGRFQGRII